MNDSSTRKVRIEYSRSNSTEKENEVVEEDEEEERKKEERLMT